MKELFINDDSLHIKNNKMESGRKLNILEVTSFSSGFCGIWFRVEKEAELLSKKGHRVFVFSSNIHRGSGKLEHAKKFEQKGKIKIYRFNAKRKVGQNTFFWNFEKEALKLTPDIIICHAYRQYYSTVALKIAKKLRIPCILVTHAPFISRKVRGWKLSLIAWFYDYFIGKKIINDYSKIFAISKWEISCLLALGARKDKIVYVPNGIPEEFFKIKLPTRRRKNKKQILFFGRIAPIKDVEILIKAFELIVGTNKNIILNLVGPIEEPYGKKIRNSVEALKLSNKVNFLGPIYNIKDKIKIIDSSDLFVLPSKREGMPQALVETMARKKIVVASDIQAVRDIVRNYENGYLFEMGNFKDLADKIFLALDDNLNNKKIMEKARNSVKQFNWSNVAEKIDVQINELLKYRTKP